jgi:hypothetical protein
MTAAGSGLPGPRSVAARAVEILAVIQADKEYPRLVASTKLYPDCWATFGGYPIVAEFNLDRDAEPLLAEALKVLALKAAVYELSGGDEAAAELVIPAPVDEMVHAVIAQFTLLVRMMSRTGIALCHMTDMEKFGYQKGNYAHQCYVAAWGQPPERYWIDAAETSRCLEILSALYASIGISDLGRRHDIAFGEQPALSR